MRYSTVHSIGSKESKDNNNSRFESFIFQVKRVKSKDKYITHIKERVKRSKDNINSFNAFISQAVHYKYQSKGQKSQKM